MANEWFVFSCMVVHLYKSYFYLTAAMWRIGRWVCNVFAGVDLSAVVGSILHQHQSENADRDQHSLCGSQAMTAVTRSKRSLSGHADSGDSSTRSYQWKFIYARKKQTLC